MSVHRFLGHFNFKARRRWLLARARSLTLKARQGYTSQTFTCWEAWPLEGETRRQIDSLRKENSDLSEILIAHIDNDGRVWSPYGRLPDLDNIEQRAFIRRYRYSLHIVLLSGKVLICKDFRGDQVGFLREWLNLATLAGKANVPALHSVDEENCKIFKNFIPGPTLRMILVNAGARILSVQTSTDTELSHMDEISKIEAVWARGREYFSTHLPENLLAELEREIHKVHACGVAGLSLTYGNIILERQTNAPYLLDFDSAHAYRFTLNPFFIYQRQKDLDTFQRIYFGERH